MRDASEGRAGHIPVRHIPGSASPDSANRGGSIRFQGSRLLEIIRKILWCDFPAVEVDQGNAVDSVLVPSRNPAFLSRHSGRRGMACSWIDAGEFKRLMRPCRLLKKAAGWRQTWERTLAPRLYSTSQRRVGCSKLTTPGESFRSSTCADKPDHPGMRV